MNVQIRPWRRGDEWLLAAAEPGLSPASLFTRFLTGTPGLPTHYLRHVATAPRCRWDAVVATHAGAVVGWAEFGRAEDGAREAELAVIVLDAWQRRGIGRALVSRLSARCLAAGVTTLSAEVLSDNVASNRLIRSFFGDLARPSRAGDLLHYRLPLAAAQSAA